MCGLLRKHIFGSQQIDMIVKPSSRGHGDELNGYELKILLLDNKKFDKLV